MNFQGESWGIKVSPPQTLSSLIKVTRTCLRRNCVFPQGGDLTCLLPTTGNGGPLALWNWVQSLHLSPLCHPVDLRAQGQQHYHGNTHTVGLTVSNQLS